MLKCVNGQMIELSDEEIQEIQSVEIEDAPLTENERLEILEQAVQDLILMTLGDETNDKVFSDEN